MDIGKMGNIQPNTTLQGYNKAGSMENPFGKVADSFVPGNKQDIKQPDLKKAAQLLMKKLDKQATESWSINADGLDGPSIIGEKRLVIGGFTTPVKAVDPETGADKWTSDLKGLVVEGKDGTLFVAGGSKTMTALDPETGKAKWSMDFNFDARVVKVGEDGTVYARTSNTIYAIDPEKQGIKWECKTIGEPEISEDRRIIVTDGFNDVSRINPDTGKPMWTYNTIGKCNSTPAFGKNGDVYACDYLGKMTAIDPETGKKKWEFRTDSSILDTPLIGPNGDIYVNNCNQHLYAVDPETGQKKWQFDGEGFNNSFASFAPDGTIVFAGGDNVYGVNPKTGMKLWEKKMPGAVDRTPIQGKDGKVYVKCWDKKIHCIKTPDIQDLMKQNIDTESEPPEAENKNLEIKSGSKFVDIGGVRLKVNQQE